MSEQRCSYVLDPKIFVSSSMVQFSRQYSKCLQSQSVVPDGAKDLRRSQIRSHYRSIASDILIKLCHWKSSYSLKKILLGHMMRRCSLERDSMYPVPHDAGVVLFCLVLFHYNVCATICIFQKVSRVILEVEEINLAPCSCRELNVLWIEHPIYNNTHRFSVSIRGNSQLSVDNVTNNTSFFAIILKRNFLTNMRFTLPRDVLLTGTSVIFCDSRNRSIDFFVSRISMLLPTIHGQWSWCRRLECWMKGFQSSLIWSEVMKSSMIVSCWVREAPSISYSKSWNYQTLRIKCDFLRISVHVIFFSSKFQFQK